MLPRDADLRLEMRAVPLQFQHYGRQLDRLRPCSDDDDYLIAVVSIQTFLPGVPTVMKDGESLALSGCRTVWPAS